MSQRKPHSESWESWSDRLIREAEARGDFDNLPGAGQPLPGYGEPYREDWWLQSLVRREKLEVLPATLSLKREIEQLRELLPEISSERELRRRLALLAERLREANLSARGSVGGGLSGVDIESFVEAWHKQVDRDLDGKDARSSHDF